MSEGIHGPVRRKPVPDFAYGYPPDPSSRARPAPSPLQPYPAPPPAHTPPPPYPGLRSHRSAVDLRPGSAAAPSGHPAVLRPGPVHVQTEPGPTPSWLAPPPSSPHEVRRVKSSSELSLGAASHDTGASSASGASRFKAALGEAQYFASGLVSHPAESTKHFTVIRHCGALVWYRGPTTSVSISILSDQPLPEDRTVWLQEKGFSGNMGMSVKALVGSKGNWIDVTPAVKAGVQHIPEADERSIQRDIKRFGKRATGRLATHVLRETHVIRIPAAATDGYFRLVLCCGEGSKKVLCGSPVLRIASTSTDAAVVRGASLSTMPLELGVKVATTVGQRVARTYAGVAGAVIENRARRVAPLVAARRVGNAAFKGYQNAGLDAAVQESWRQNRATGYSPLMTGGGGGVMEEISIIGSDAGPDAPFPLPFEAKVVRGSGLASAELGIPTANLSGAPETVKVRLSGVFAAWVGVIPGSGAEDISYDWHEAIVTIAPLRSALPGVAMSNAVVAHILYDFDNASLVGARLKVVLMGYVHPAMPGATAEALLEEHARDVMTTTASLSREAWGPEEALAKVRAARSERSFTDRLGDVTGRVQQQVDRIPLHWAGVRSESGLLRDQAYGKGGMWIPR
ncbi:hypothetical protein B0I35DRAFT_404767 [Stachybotrys elegans]|uniref:Riboflavin kinase n=1 Tax=Stachybotrys elegans TaxID=80388 RepID=A0A8K0WXC0_9HYPO|nr:hypothetical protein B0I35DRAFT_404767 [Stachybotrys elegans]